MATQRLPPVQERPWDSLPVLTAGEWEKEIAQLPLAPPTKQAQLSPFGPRTRNVRNRGFVPRQNVVLMIKGFEQLLEGTFGYYLRYIKNTQDTQASQTAMRYRDNLVLCMRNIPLQLAMVLCTEEDVKKWDATDLKELSGELEKWLQSAVRVVAIPDRCKIIEERLTAVGSTASPHDVKENVQQQVTYWRDLVDHWRKVNDGWADLCRRVKLEPSYGFKTPEALAALESTRAKIETAMVRADEAATADLKARGDSGRFQAAQPQKNPDVLPPQLGVHMVGLAKIRSPPRALLPSEEAIKVLTRRVRYISEAAAAKARAARPDGVYRDLHDVPIGPDRRKVVGKDTPYPKEHKDLEKAGERKRVDLGHRLPQTPDTMTGGRRGATGRPGSRKARKGAVRNRTWATEDDVLSVAQDDTEHSQLSLPDATNDSGDATTFASQLSSLAAAAGTFAGLFVVNFAKQILNIMDVQQPGGGKFSVQRDGRRRKKGKNKAKKGNEDVPDSKRASRSAKKKQELARDDAAEEKSVILAGPSLDKGVGPSAAQRMQELIERRREEAESSHPERPAETMQSLPAITSAKKSQVDLLTSMQPETMPEQTVKSNVVDSTAVLPETLPDTALQSDQMVPTVDAVAGAGTIDPLAEVHVPVLPDMPATPPAEGESRAEADSGDSPDVDDNVSVVSGADNDSDIPDDSSEVSHVFDDNHSDIGTTVSDT